MAERGAMCETCDGGDWGVERPVSPGKAWSPSEAEVFGSCVFGHPLYSALGQTQLPVFRARPCSILFAGEPQTRQLRTRQLTPSPSYPAEGGTCVAQAGGFPDAVGTDGSALYAMPCFVL